MDSEQEKNRNVVIDFYNAFSACDVDAFDGILSEHWINHPADQGRENTRNGFKLGVIDFHSAFDNFHIQRDVMVSDGDFVVCRITMRGRHIRHLGSWYPSGRDKVFYGMDMHRFSDGKIVETWHFERME